MAFSLGCATEPLVLANPNESGVIKACFYTQKGVDLGCIDFEGNMQMVELDVPVGTEVGAVLFDDQGGHSLMSNWCTRTVRGWDCGD